MIPSLKTVVTLLQVLYYPCHGTTIIPDFNTFGHTTNGGIGRSLAVDPAVSGIQHKQQNDVKAVRAAYHLRPVTYVNWWALF